jgi:hypothetical protein
MTELMWNIPGTKRDFGKLFKCNGYRVLSKDKSKKFIISH